MSPERLVSALRTWRWEYAWAVFTAANLVWMEAMPGWYSVPFHFVWVSFTVLYGFRIWTNKFTWALVLLVVVTTGVVLVQLWIEGIPTDEVLEVPLMFGMFLAMMLHTTRRKAAIVELERVSEQNVRMLERERSFVQNASHELRTPITVALAHAELVQLTTSEPSVKDDLEIIVDEMGRLRRLADRLLLLAAADAPDFVHLTPTALAPLVTDAARRWAPVPRRWLVGRQDAATVLADPERLTPALDTLLENAIKATDDGDLIELSVRRHDGSATIAVSDNGPGIAPELLDTVFERFTTAGTHRGSPSSFGLGLSIVNAVAEAHGGSVTAGNRPGGGAVVALRLPLADGRGLLANGRSQISPARVPRAAIDAAPAQATLPR